MKKKSHRIRAGIARLERQVADRERRGIGTATVERLRRAGQDIEVSPEGRQRLTDAPLQQLFSRRLLARPNEAPEDNARRFAAGERLQRHAHEGALDRLAGRDWRLPPGGGIGTHPGGIYPASEWALMHRENWRKAVAALGKGRIGEITLGIVVEERRLVDLGRAVLGRRQEAQARAATLELLLEGLDILDEVFNGDRHAAHRWSNGDGPEAFSRTSPSDNA